MEAVPKVVERCAWMLCLGVVLKVVEVVLKVVEGCAECSGGYANGGGGCAESGRLCLLEVPEGIRRVLLCISRYLAFVPQGSLGKPHAAVCVTCRLPRHATPRGTKNPSFFSITCNRADFANFAKRNERDHLPSKSTGQQQGNCTHNIYAITGVTISP